MPVMPKIGGTVRGKYRVEGVLGEGGVAVVFRTHDTERDRDVALKVLRPEMAADAEIVARFQREARAARQLTGPHSVRVLELSTTEDGLPYLAMELTDGHDLAQEVDLRGALPIDEATLYVLQACRGIAEAHALGIIHRDLKPSNLLLAEAGGTRNVKVLDFGLSKVEDDERRLTTAEASFGTPLYMSPEQIRSTKDVDARTDVWSLGVILYELLVGCPPFAGGKATATAKILLDDPEPPRALRPELPEELERIVLKALAKAPDGRYPSVEAMGRALQPFAAPAPIGGERLERVRREVISNRNIRLAPAGPTSPTVVRAHPAPAASARGAPRRRETSPILWVAVGLLVGLPVAFAVVRLLLGR
jgi:serine/threonine-protein kinase